MTALEEEGALVPAILSAPDDDAAKLAYADWLTARSDPMGSYIELSVQLANGKRVKGKRDRYLSRYQWDMMGAAVDFIKVPTYGVYGMFESIRTRNHDRYAGDEASRRDAASDWRWAFVRELIASGDLSELFRRAPLLSLERCNFAALETLGAWTENPNGCPTLTTLENCGLVLPDGDPDALTAKLPNLSTIITACPGPPPPEAFFRHSLIRGLTRLELEVEAFERAMLLSDWLEALHTSEYGVPVTLLSTGMDVRWRPDRTADIILKSSLSHASMRQAHVDMFQQCPAGILNSANIQYRCQDSVRAELEPAVEHL